MHSFIYPFFGANTHTADAASLIQIIGTNVFYPSSKLSAIACYCLSTSSSGISDSGRVFFLFVLSQHSFPRFVSSGRSRASCRCSSLALERSFPPDEHPLLDLFVCRYRHLSGCCIGKQLNMYTLTAERPCTRSFLYS